jgi:uncharacterized protein YjbJ (UPF0337 family)
MAGRPLGRSSYNGAPCRLTSAVQARAKTDAGRQKPSGNFSTHKRTNMNRDQVKGAAEQGKGKIKEAAGNLTGNKRLEREGEADQVKGKVQKNYGDAKENVKDGIDKL